MSVKPSVNNEDKQEKKEYGTAVSLSTGLSFGFILGLLLGNLGMGLSLGLGMGGLVNAVREHREGRQGSQPAIAIWVLALLIVISLWIWTG
jgi:hypothetical protein